MLTDLLIRIKNAQAAKLPSVKAPYSALDFAVAELLAKHKYVEAAEKKGRMPKRIIEVKLRYTENGPTISGIQFLSKSSRRLYSGYKEMPSAMQGYGLIVVSTPKGIMTGSEARKAKLGGALLFKIW